MGGEGRTHRELVPRPVFLSLDGHGVGEEGVVSIVMVEIYGGGGCRGFVSDFFFCNILSLSGGKGGKDLKG